MTKYPGVVDTKDPSINKRKRLGECYAIAAEYIFADLACTLVHGTIQGAGRPPIGHAWVVRSDGQVFEPTSGHVMSQVEFDAFFNPTVQATYSVNEAVKQMTTTEHYGPWKE